MRTKTTKSVFSINQALIAVALIVGIAVFGPLATNHKIAPTEEIALSPAANVTTWNNYKDSGYAAASGISIKYPADWKIDIPRVKSVGNTKQPTAVISERVIYLPSTQSPMDEWNTCADAIGADACGAAPGDKTINGKESTINGYAAYAAKMQTSSGDTYHVTVIRGNATANGLPFVEFTTSSTNQAALNTYADIMASATFNN